MIDILSALAAGWLCAVTQGAFFFSLQTLWSATFITYFAVVLLWLGGSWLGLRLPDALPEWPLALLTAAGPMAAYTLLQAAPFDGRWWPVYALLIIASSLYAGYFFKRRRARFKRVQRLFLWEALGFVGGLVVTFFGMVFSGMGFVVWGPGAAAAALLACLGLGWMVKHRG